MFDKFRNALKGDKVSQFWEWFAANEEHVYSFETNQEAIFDQIGSRLRRVNPELCFAFSKVREDGRREFVISAGGILSAFPAVESLSNKAPDLGRWIWVKYRPRLEKMLNVEYGGRTVRADDVRYVIEPQGKKVGIALFFQDYTEAQRDIDLFAFGDMTKWLYDGISDQPVVNFTQHLQLLEERLNRV